MTEPSKGTIELIQEAEDRKMARSMARVLAKALDDVDRLPWEPSLREIVAAIRRYGKGREDES